MARFIFAVVTLTGVYLLIRKAIKSLVQDFLDADQLSQSHHVNLD